MSLTALHFARALERGRRQPAPPPSREAVLVSLLTKRAVAARMGASDIEGLLRAQIRWALPMLPHDQPSRIDDELAEPLALG